MPGIVTIISWLEQFNLGWVIMMIPCQAVAFKALSSEFFIPGLKDPSPFNSDQSYQLSRSRVLSLALACLSCKGGLAEDNTYSL